VEVSSTMAAKDMGIPLLINEHPAIMSTFLKNVNILILQRYLTPLSTYRRI